MAKGNGKASATVSKAAINGILWKVNPPDFLNIKIKIPSLPEQRAIADILEVAEREVLNMTLKLDALKRQK